MRCARWPERRQQQRRLADAGLAADEDERGGHEPAAEDAVELGHAGRDPLGLLGVDVDEPSSGLGRAVARATVRRLSSTSVPNVAAAGALAEPAPGRVAALGAGVVNGARLWPCLASLRSGPDGVRDDSVTLPERSAAHAGTPLRSAPRSSRDAPARSASRRASQLTRSFRVDVAARDRFPRWVVQRAASPAAAIGGEPPTRFRVDPAGGGRRPSTMTSVLMQATTRRRSHETDPRASVRVAAANHPDCVRDRAIALGAATA